MHIIQSPDWTAVVGSQQVSLESTGVCASLTALGHGMLHADRESSEGLEQAQGGSEASSGKGARCTH